MKRLSTEASLKPYVAQFVPIKIDVASDDYKIWRRDHKPEKGAIPQMYIVRADGEELYNKVGGLPTDKLQLVLSGALKSSGVILSDGDLPQVEAVLKKSSEQIEAGQIGDAVKTVSQYRGAMDASIACFAEPVLELRKNVQKLVELSQSDIKAVNDSLDDSSESDADAQLRIAQKIAELNRNLSRFTPVKKDLTALNRTVAKQKDLAVMVSDVKKFDALRKSRRPNTTKLKELVEKYPESSFGREVAEVLRQAERSENKSGQSMFAAAKSRTWTSSDGAFTVDATAIGMSGDKVVLKLKSGKEIKVGVEDLSSADQKWIQANK